MRPDLPIQTQIAGYLDSLLTQRQLSPHTISGYGRDLADLACFADASGVAGNSSSSTAESLAATAIRQVHIRKLAAQLHARGLSPGSIARKLSAWRGFFGWLSEQQALPRNPVDGVKAPKRSRPLPKALSPDDAIALVSSNKPGKNPEDADQLCNRAMFELLYSSGLRVSELIGLDLHYVQQKDYQSQGWLDDQITEVTVTGKGNKMRTVPVGAQAGTALRAWLTARASLVRPDSGPDSHALFLNTQGRRATPTLVQRRIKAHARAIGIPSNVHPHVMRHSFASHVLQSSGDLRAVQEMLGHASIASTQVYTSLDFQRLAQVYDAAHPRAKKRPA